MDGSGRGDGRGPAPELAEIVVTEPLDLAGVKEVGAVLDRVIDLRPERLVIDISACRHVDAAGIGLLLDAHRRMWRQGGRLTLRSPSPRIRRLLQVSRVDGVFHIVAEPSVGESTGPAGAVPRLSRPGSAPTWTGAA